MWLVMQEKKVLGKARAKLLHALAIKSERLYLQITQGVIAMDRQKVGGPLGR